MGLITPQQMRAARAMLDWKQSDLAKRSGVSLPTIKRLETGGEILVIRSGTREALEKAFTDAGIVFISETEKYAPGISLKKRLEGSPYDYESNAEMISAIAAAAEVYEDVPVGPFLHAMHRRVRDLERAGTENPWRVVEEEVASGQFRLEKDTIPLPRLQLRRGKKQTALPKPKD